MVNRLRIFVSHAWSEDALYESFVSSINAQLGESEWIDLSIPKSRAVDPFEEELNKSESRRLQEEIEKLNARLKDPKLSVALLRYAYGPEGRYEVETRGSILRKLESLLNRRDEIQDRNILRDANQWEVSKRVAMRISEFPELAFKIRERVAQADCVFILISDMLLFRRWVEFEIEVASDVGVRTVAIDFGTGAGQHVTFRIKETVQWASFFQGDFCW